MASKHASCKSHVLLECGDKVCVVPGTNGDRKGLMSEAHKRSLERFHAFIHRQQAKAHAAEARRPKGDGLIEGRIGGRLTTRQVIRDYERLRDKANRTEAIGDHLGALLRNNAKSSSSTSLIHGHAGKAKPYPFPHKSKFVGTRRKIRAGYRPRRKPATATQEATATA